MQMPIIVGVFIAIAFLVAFSEWFYGVTQGIKNTVPEDEHYTKRVVKASIVSIVLMIIAFLGIAVISECPNSYKDRAREGAFANLRCEEYSKIKNLSDKLFQRSQDLVNYGIE